MVVASMRYRDRITMVAASMMCRDNENVTPSWRSGFTSAVDSSSGLVVRIPGSHPGGPGSIPGVGNPFWTPGIEYIFGNVKMVFFFLLGAARSRKNIASAGNRTRINCLEGSYADHYTTDAVLTLLLLSAQVPQPHSPAMCI